MLDEAIGFDESATSALELDVRERTALRPVARIAILFGLFGLATLWFSLIAAHVIAGTADTATVVLEGQTMNAGSWALHGWSLSLDSFWSIDAVFYAIVIRLAGLGPWLFHVVPALLVALLVASALWCATRGLDRRAAAIASVVVVSLLAMPSPDFAYFLLNGPWHIGTTAFCLVAFVGVSGGRFGAPWCVAVLALALGLLGDLMTLGFGFLPIGIAGLLAIARERNWRAGAWNLTALVASVALAVVIRAIATAAGTFTLTNRNLPIRSSQISTNLAHLPARVAAFLGVGRISIPPATGVRIDNGPAWLEAVHVLGVAVVVIGVLVGLYNLARALFRPRRDARGWRIDDVLLIALIADLAIFVVAVPDNAVEFSKYLIAGTVFGMTLGARVIARGLARIRSARVAFGCGVASLAIVAGFAGDAGSAFAAPTPVQPAAALGHFLLGHHLTSGIGDYWSSSLVTVETGDKVRVRPIDTTGGTKIVRFARLSSADWYAGRRFQFLVYDSARPWHHVNEQSATATFGPPTHVYQVGTYRILRWSRPITVSSVIPEVGSPLRLFWR